MDEKYIKEVQFTPQKVGYLLCTLTYIYKTRQVMESSYEHSCENLDTVANTVCINVLLQTIHLLVNVHVHFVADPVHYSQLTY